MTLVIIVKIQNNNEGVIELLKLSFRLLALAQMVPPGTRVADIGTDHAFLPCYLLLKKISPFVIGVDVHRGPYTKACATVCAYNLKDSIELRLGNGLAVISPAEVDTVIIAGMGGTTIRDILAKSPEVTTTLKKLILQPMTGAEAVRSWLYQQGWRITEEELIYEDNQYYQVIGAEKNQTREWETNQKVAKQRKLEQEEFEQEALGKSVQEQKDNKYFTALLKELAPAYGPLLLKNRHPLLPGLLEKDIAGLQDILLELAKSNNEEAKKRYREYLLKVEKLKELKEWLLAAKL